MGLDIYCHRVKKTVADKYELSTKSNRSEIFEALNTEAASDFKKTTSRMLAYLRTKYNNCTQDEYQAEYIKFIQRLRKNVAWYGEYEFHLQPLGYNGYRNILEEVKTPDVVETVFKAHSTDIYDIHDAYFRKVNFIYAFFREDMVDESCVADKYRIGQLIDVCENVLEHRGNEAYAKKHLPTTEGFFFGSTEYDQWYWNDVKNCIKQMRKLYKAMSDDDFVIWEFSW